MLIELAGSSSSSAAFTLAAPSLAASSAAAFALASSSSAAFSLAASSFVAFYMSTTYTNGMAEEGQERSFRASGESHKGGRTGH